LNQIIKYLTIAFYTYLLGFSAGILRVFIAKNIRWFFPRKNREEVLGIGGIVTLIILPNASTQFGFLLSYLCTYGIIVVSQWKINSKLINILLINLICEIIAIPFVIKMQNGISITNLIFGPIIAGYYTLTFAWFFCTWWCWWLAAIHLIWINFFHDLFNWCLLINVQINFSQISITDEILLGLTIGSLLLFSQNFAKSQH
jgi:ComEC/Rec2-related protein